MKIYKCDDCKKAIEDEENLYSEDYEISADLLEDFLPRDVDIEESVQDEGRTLKIFYKEKK